MRIIKDWDQVWFAMSNGDIAQYQSLKGTVEIEFYELLELHEKKIELLNAKRKY